MIDAFALPPRIAKPAIIRPRAPEIIRPDDPQFHIPPAGRMPPAVLGMFALTGLSGFGAASGSGPVLTTILNETLATNGFGWNGYTVRPVIAAAALTDPGFNPTQMRVTIATSSALALTFAKLYVGHKAGAGDAMDAASLTQITFDTGSAGASLSAGATKLSDWATFGWDRATALVFSMYIASANDGSIRNTGFTNADYYYKAAADEAATANVSGGTYSSVASSLIFITKIEVQ